MSEINVLQHVVQILKGLGLESTVCEKSPDVPFDVALVSLGMDEKERPIVLQVIHAEQSVVQAAPQELQEELSADSDCHLLSFIVAVPFEIPAETVPEVLRLLNLANKSLPLGYFNFSEIEKSVYYSYGYPVFSTPPCEMTILMVINTLLFAKETFFPTIESVANSRETVETLIQ
jgi:hypothetical protein